MMTISSETSLVASFIGAFQGALSVLITLFAGYLVARRKYLDHDTVRRLSKLCSVLFLPCLIIVQMGPELTTSKLKKQWIIPVWGFVSTVVAHLLGWIGQVAFKLPHWTIVASGRPNANALPLLLLQSLQYTGVLDNLSSGEPVHDTVNRAKSLILLNVIVQQTFTFQIAPNVLRYDKRDKNGKKPDVEGGRAPDANSLKLPPIVQDTERVGLLQGHDEQSYGTSNEYAEYSGALRTIVDQSDVHWPSSLAAAERPMKAVYNSMSPPLIAAIVALIIGITPPLHEAFLNKEGVFYSSLTQSLKNLGDLFVVLQTVVVGAELALVPRAHPGVIAISYPITIRFLVMPALSILFVWSTAGKGWYVDDKLVWFLLILIPSGPSAMLLASVAELVDVDQGPIAGYLIISYLISPAMAVVCSLALEVVENASK